LDAGSYEEFSIDRIGAIDPLADYFGSGGMATIGGGLRSTPVLSSQPGRFFNGAHRRYSMNLMPWN
jgi:hypothetical protein